MRFTVSETKERSFATSTQSSGSTSRNDTFSAWAAASSGTISTDWQRSFDSWSSTSNVRMESISSPKKSMRNGNSWLKL